MASSFDASYFRRYYESRRSRVYGQEQIAELARGVTGFVRWFGGDIETVLDVGAKPSGPFAPIQAAFQGSQAALLEFYQSAAGGGLSLAAAEQQLVENYHTNVAPFCALAARSFFSR